jgi:preprotein translocase subunit SecA
MDRALPEDVPIESNMVTKSVERAQSTVEQRNAETRKNVLKYDEVYNQQRKVVYQRRVQILEQGDLREETIEAIGDVADSLVATHCEAELDDTWDLDGLLTELQGFWSTEVTAEGLDGARSLRQIRDLITEDGVVRYEAREAELGESVMRQIERQIMLQLIDQRWRDHLTEMAHLREGINLRAMGQRDPLVEWQSEGFELFSDMMHSLNVDYVRYLMHVEVVPPQPAADQSGSDPTEATESKAPAAKQTSLGAATTTDVVESRGDDDAPTETSPRSTTPFVKDEWDKTPRNAPCPCGSGKKFKQCHGAR